MTSAHVYGFVVGVAAVLLANYFFNFPSKKG
jgi:hypothetical protein